MPTDNDWLITFPFFSSVGDTVIDQNLRLPEFYCRESDHRTCVHADIFYDENFHQDDRVQKLRYSDTFTIPPPQVAYGVWKLLDDCICNRKKDEKPTFYVQWGALEYNVVEITTIKELGKEFERIKTDVQKETEFLENAKTHPVPVGIENLDQEDCDISSVTQKILYDKLYLKDSTPLSTIERTISDYSGLSNEQLYNFSHFERQLTEDDLHCVVEILNSQDDAKDLYIVLTPELKNKDVLKTYSMSKDVATAEMVHVIVNVNLSKGMVNFEEKNGHWTYVAILNDKEIIYGDPLGSRSIPKNLVEVMNLIFLPGMEGIL